MAIVSAKYQDINFPFTSEMKLWSDVFVNEENNTIPNQNA